MRSSTSIELYVKSTNAKSSVATWAPVEKFSIESKILDIVCKKRFWLVFLSFLAIGDLSIIYSRSFFFQHLVNMKGVCFTGCRGLLAELNTRTCQSWGKEHSIWELPGRSRNSWPSLFKMD